MNNPGNPSNFEIRPKTEYQNLNDVQLEETIESEAEYIVRVGLDTPKSKIEEDVKKELEKRFWWFWKSFQEKGSPKEQIEITSGDAKLVVYNFSEILNESQVREIQDAFSFLQGSRVKDKLASVPYCLIDNNSSKNIKTDEDLSGLSPEGLNAIILYPRSLSQKEHRIPDVSNLEGTVLHEWGHVLQDENFKKEWVEQFGWEVNKVADVPGQPHRFYVNVRPELVPNSYTLFDPQEDISDSLVATVKNPTSIDPNRVDFIKSHWLGEGQKVDSVVERNIGSKISLPSKKVFKYAVVRKNLGFKLGSVASNPEK